MRHGYGITKIFAERELRDYLQQIKSTVIQSIENENDDYLLNVNANDYIKHKLSEAHVEQLVIHQDKIYASSSWFYKCQR